MSKGEFKKILEERMKPNYPVRATDGFVLIPYDVTRLLKEAKEEFPTAEKLVAEVKARLGDKYRTPSGEELMEALNEERDKWFQRWFGDE